MNLVLADLQWFIFSPNVMNLYYFIISMIQRSKSQCGLNKSASNYNTTGNQIMQHHRANEAKQEGKNRVT